MRWVVRALAALLGILLIHALQLANADAGTLDRCATYTQEVRTAHAQYFGLDFPWWYSVAQLQKESGCRDILSRDGVGSEGAAQITYRWWAKPLTAAGIPEVRTRKNHLRAQAFINYDAWKRARRSGSAKLWVAYQIYNGGGLVLKEISRAGYTCHTLARRQCRRKNITFNNGQVINACDINYDYPLRIERYAESYRAGPDSEAYPFW